MTQDRRSMLQRGLAMACAVALSGSLRVAADETVAEFPAKAIRAALPAFVFIARGQGQGVGSGAILSEDGYIITNAHVVGDDTRLNVRTGEGIPFRANVVGRLRAGDLALLKVESDRPLPFLRLADSDRLRVGQLCVAIGNPAALGLFDQEATVTTGVISGLNQFKMGGVYNNAIVSDAAINPGNSGGPLLDRLGNLIGVNGGIETRLGLRSNTGLGYAIPSNQIALWLPALKDASRIDVYRGRFLGVSFESEAEKAPEVGALVKVVQPDSDAERAGLKAGDLILRAHGLDVWNSIRFTGILNMLPPNTTLRMEGRRGEQDFALAYALPERKPADTGFTLAKPAKDDTHVAIEDVKTGSTADEAGLKPGDRLVGIGEQALTGPPAMQYAILSRVWIPSLVSGMVVELDVQRQTGDTVEDIRIRYTAE